ncbi:dUTP diphosphatase [Bacillus subtilis]|uniref:dUTP diphosphatase n=1 Tax=Bacillus subtilis TaxID=1423 RepID=UPI001366C508|nr:deoxyuridine 5'-triphosphate nucleotidohydrolase [Bacillus subtilis]QHM15340.1 Deoxyuridine 5'-triphosphate nucleotidohydrolase [Bacillus subtilis]
MNVNIKRLSPDAQIPAYVHESNAGFDVSAAEDVIIEPGETVLVPTGLAFEIPEGYLNANPTAIWHYAEDEITCAARYGRRRLSWRGRSDCRNITQKIGEENNRYLFVDGGCENTEKAEFFDFNLDDYRYGSVFVPDNTYKIRKGDRIAQAVIKPIEQVVFTEVDALGDSDRGEGGFGWSGTTFRKEY